MNRYGLSVRARTKIAQKLPAELDEKVMAFHRFVLTQRKRNNYDLSQIANMDETPMCFDMVPSRSVDHVGTKTVMVKTTGHEKSHFTCVLAVTADGIKLAPYVIFKRKTIPKSLKFVPGVIVRAHPKGWMDETGVLDWFNCVWNKRPGAMLKPKALLVWDSFRAHLTQGANKAAAKLETDLAVIPGGLTSILQPLDVSINKPFKDKLRQKWVDWMMAGNQKLTKAGNISKPDITVVVRWTKEAWDDIPCEMVKKYFLKCGISNNMDGTQDDCLFEDFDDVGSISSEHDNYTADIEILDEAYNQLYNQSDSDVTDDDDMPDETFQIISCEDEDDQWKDKAIKC